MDNMSESTSPFNPISIASADEHPAVLALRLFEARQLLGDLSDAFYQWVAYKDWSGDESIRELLRQVEKCIKEGQSE